MLNDKTKWIARKIAQLTQSSLPIQIHERTYWTLNWGYTKVAVLCVESMGMTGERGGRLERVGMCKEVWVGVWVSLGQVA